MFLRVATWIFMAVFLAGCATPGENTSNYSQPEIIPISNEVYLESDFETVWNGLVRRLATGFFVVNNIEKESRLINVSFSSSTPEQYVDCGTSVRTYERGDESERIEYNSAADAVFRYAEGMDQSGVNAIVLTVNRSTQVEGRMNVYVAPRDEGTEVTVNSRYILTVNISGVRQVINVNDIVMQSARVPAESFSVSFNTNQSGDGPDDIVCVSRGVLEQQILDMARASSAP